MCSSDLFEKDGIHICRPVPVSLSIKVEAISFVDTCVDGAVAVRERIEEVDVVHHPESIRELRQDAIDIQGPLPEGIIVATREYTQIQDFRIRQPLSQLINNGLNPPRNVAIIAPTPEAIRARVTAKNNEFRVESVNFAILDSPQIGRAHV